jgi:succinate dehydrogenase / fumarate reductase, membrane anchor subunit
MAMVKHVLVGAHYGLRDWVTQRVTAAVMAVYALLFVIVLLAARPTNYGTWKALFSGQAMKLATFVFFVSLFLHAWIGMRDILMDYVASVAVRLGLQIVVVLLLVAWGGWAAQILWSV